MEQGKLLIDTWSTALSEVNHPTMNNASGWGWELGGWGQGLRMALELVHAQIATSYKPLRSKRSAVLETLYSKRLRRLALCEEALTLDNLQTKQSTQEVSQVQATGMEKLPLAISSQTMVSMESREADDNIKKNHKALGQEVETTVPSSCTTTKPQY